MTLTEAPRRTEQLPHGNKALGMESKCVPSDSESRVLGFKELPTYLKSWARAM